MESDLPIVEPLYTNYPPSALLSSSPKSSDILLYPSITRKISLYVHIPFCKSVCTFCHLLAMASRDKKLMESYVAALTKEIVLISAKLQRSPNIDAIMFGGGTPSYLEPELIDMILKSVKANFSISSNCEITVECHPATLTRKKLAKYHGSGINRLSIGVQSFQFAVLKSCGRRYSYGEVADTIKEARRIGFENVNIDLMLGLPKQTALSVKNTCAKILSIRPEQISLYPMTIGPKSILTKLIMSESVKVPTESEKSEMYDIMYESFTKAGYKLPTVNNFISSEEFVNKYALNNWSGIVDRIGIGIGAYSYCRNRQHKNIATIADYFASIHELRLPVAHTMFISREELRRRKVIFNLQNTFLDKTSYGFDFNSIFKDELKILEDKGFIRNFPDKVELTYTGRKFLYYVQKEFFSINVREKLHKVRMLK